MRGVEKFRDKYHLDETEAHRNGMLFNVTLHIIRESWFPFSLLLESILVFSLGVCMMMSFNTEVAIKGG